MQRICSKSVGSRALLDCVTHQIKHNCCAAGSVGEGEGGGRHGAVDILLRLYGKGGKMNLLFDSRPYRAAVCSICSA